jgi:hypothetical protein
VSESPHGPLNPYFSIRVRNFIQVCLGWTKDRVVVEERGHVREQFASIVAKELSLINDVTRQTLVPMARVVQMKSRDLQNKESWQPGSVQFFIDKAKDGFTHFQVPEWTIFNTMESYLPKTDKAIAKKMDEGDFQRIVVLDYLLGNIDFNLGNILFVKRDRSGNGSALGIAARDSSSVHQSPKPLSAHSIDYWFSMPKAHPVKWLDKRNMHRWKALPYAEQHVMASIKTRVRDVWEEIAWQAQRFFSDDKMTKVIVDEGGAPRTITVTAIECLNHRKRALLERGDALKTLIPDPADWFVKANRALTV